MKKILFSLIAALGLSVAAHAATQSVWSGSYEFGAEGNGWQEVAAEKFANLQLGDKLVVTVSGITNPDGWAQINLAGKNPWTVVPGTNWGDVLVGENTYEISDADLLASIKAGGLGIQGKYFVLTDISIDSESVKPEPQPVTSVWSGSYEFGAEGNGWQEVAAEKFANLQLGDKLVVTVSEITNPDGWAQINLAGKDPWTVVPGTNWGDVLVGENTYEISNADLLASIKAGGLGIQGKYFVLTDVSIKQTITGITVLSASKANDACYTMAGIKVARPTHGIYLQKGKKIIVK